MLSTTASPSCVVTSDVDPDESRFQEDEALRNFLDPGARIERRDRDGRRRDTENVVVDEAPDEPRARDTIDLGVFTSDSFHDSSSASKVS